MRSELRKRFAWVAGAVATLFIFFFLCRHVFLEFHELGDWPFVLLIFGLVVIFIVAFFDGRRIMVSTPLGYIVGFVIGKLFNVNGLDPGGGTTNNFWLLWTNTLLIFITIGVVWEIARMLLKRVSDGTNTVM